MKNRRILHAHTHTKIVLGGLMNKILVTAICGLCATNALASQGCTITYQDGRTVDKVVYGYQSVSGEVYFGGVDGSARPIDGTFNYSKKDSSFSKLKSVNGTNIVAPSQPDKKTTKAIFFSCDKFPNDSHFGYECQDDYKGGTHLGIINNLFGIYDQCIEPDGGCTLEFSDDTRLNNIDSADWFFNEDGGSSYLKKIDGYYAKDKFITDLVSVDGKKISDIQLNSEKVASVKFKCSGWDGNADQQFAYDCNYGYEGGKTVAEDNELRYECVEPELSGGCTLKFSDGTLDNINYAWWSLDEDSGPSIKIKKVDGSDAESKPITDLVSVNGSPVDIQTDPAKVISVRFKCGGFDSNVDQQFAYFCSYGYAGGKIVAEDNNLRYQCVADTDVSNTSNDTLNWKQLNDMLNKHFSKSNQWKNDQGKFNTARLASDSIAATVLGTVGGVVTSVVMKKAQAKKGFESMKCTINGQDVAGYGDEFSVQVK